MNTKNGFLLIGFIVVVAAVLMGEYVISFAVQFASLPWWLYFVLAGILYSGYKFVTISKEEHDQEQDWVEEEGNVYIKRMEKEKEERQKVSGDQ
jgi:hypothetical protein